MDLDISELNRFDRLFDIFTMVSNGNYSVKAEVRDVGDYFDSLATGINMMIDNLRKHTLQQSYAEGRINEILDAVVKVGRGDFNVSCETRDSNDLFDALSVGINMMIEDLKNYVEDIKRTSTGHINI